MTESGINLFIMKSTLRVEFDFDKKSPVIRVRQAKNSDDIRDQMLQSFVETALFHEHRIVPVFHNNETADAVTWELRVEQIGRLVTIEKSDRLTFGEALEYIKAGRKVRLPEWRGWWYKKNGEIIVHKEDGTEVETPWFKETIWREDWQLVYGS